jgi:hypothetical protein
VSKTLARLIQDVLTQDRHVQVHGSMLDYHTGNSFKSEITTHNVVNDPLLYLDNAPEPSIHFVE